MSGQRSPVGRSRGRTGLPKADRRGILWSRPFADTSDAFSARQRIAPRELVWLNESRAAWWNGAVVDHIAVLTDLNRQFIDAFCKGSWEILAPILSPGFRYLDGNTGEGWQLDRYIEDLRTEQPTLEFDEVAVHVDGDAAVVSARTWVRPGRFNRYVDSYELRDGRWTCYHACVWRLAS